MKNFILKEIKKCNQINFHIEKAFVNSNVENHTHDFCEIFFVVSGTANHTYGCREYSVSKGDVFVLKGNEQHSFTNCTDFKLFNIMFLVSDFTDYEDCKSLAGFWVMFINEYISPSDHIYSYQKLVGNDFDYVHGTCEKMLDEYTKEYNGYVTMCKSMLMQLIVFLSREYQSNNENKANLNFRLALIILFIEQNFTDNITIDDLASKIYLSKRHFNRVFKQIYHKTPLNYIIDLRIAYSKKLLSTGCFTVTQVAHMCGFNDANYFTKVYKKTQGNTPKCVKTN